MDVVCKYKMCVVCRKWGRQAVQVWGVGKVGAGVYVGVGR